MALNKTIIKKIRAKTECEPALGKFLVKLLECEGTEPGRWKTMYRLVLEASCKEEKEHADN